MASDEHGQSLAGERSGRRDHGRERHRRDGDRSEPVPLGTRVRGLARHDAKAKFRGGKERLGGISKRGDKYIRSLMIAGAVAIRVTPEIAQPRTRSGCAVCWLESRRRSSLSRSPIEPPASYGAVMRRGSAYRATESLGPAAA